MIYLGEAVWDEKKMDGYESGHQIGRQRDDELRIVPFYRKPWMYVFRSVDSNVANAMAIRVTQAVNSKYVGYGQPTRATGINVLLRDPDPSHIKTPVDFDCSALVNTVAKITWEGIGHKISLTGHERTADMLAAYSKIPQFFENVTDKVNLDTGYGLKVGDIIFRPSQYGHGHTALVVKTDTKVNTTPLFVAHATKLVPVYLKSTGTAKQTAWHQLDVGNLCDVCDERKNRYYVRIGTVYGWVNKKYLKK